MRAMREALGDVHFTTAGPWQVARSGRVFDERVSKVKTALTVSDAFAHNVVTLSEAASAR